MSEAIPDLATNIDPPQSALRRWFSQLRSHEDKFFLLVTVIIGALVGLVVVAFIEITEKLGSRLYPASGEPWRRLVMPVAGALISGILLVRFFPDARGSGIPQTKVALVIRNGRIRLKTVIGRFLCSSLALASGIALGREGPSAQMGAGIASVLGRKLGFSQSKIKALVPVGCSAALAAAFNTPISAVLFALEEIVGDMHAPVLGSVVLSSATAWVVLHLFLGDEPLFHVPAYHLRSNWELLIYAVLGIAGGFVSLAFTKLTLLIRERFMRLPKHTRWWQPAIGGLVIGGMGWFFPKVLGVGYNYVNEFLNGSVALQAVLLLLVLKLVGTAACYGTGNTGGIFGPSLFLGALLGGATGAIAHQLWPDYTGTEGAYALVGMGATFAGIIRTPFTSVFMIFELTRDYSIVVPLMIANLTSFYISYRYQRKPIYEALLDQDGIHLPSHESRGSRSKLTVAQALSKTVAAFSPETPIKTVVSEVDGETALIAENEKLWGVLSKPVLLDHMARGEGDLPASALLPDANADDKANLTAANFPHIHLDHSLEQALERMGNSGHTLLPVVDRVNVRKLRGVVTLDGILQVYGLQSEKTR